jgi:hypothetical protein
VVTVTVSQQRSRGAWHANYSAAVLCAWKALREASPATARGDDDENGRPVLCKAHGFSGAAAAAAASMVLPLPLGSLAPAWPVSARQAGCTFVDLGRVEISA